MNELIVDLGQPDGGSLNVVVLKTGCYPAQYYAGYSRYDYTARGWCLYYNDTNFWYRELVDAENAAIALYERQRKLFVDHLLNTNS